jgi:hypothetical protein
MLEAMARTALRLRRKNSAWASGGPAGGQQATFAGMLETMARIALARHAAEGLSRIPRIFVGFLNRRATINEGWW